MLDSTLERKKIIRKIIPVAKKELSTEQTELFKKFLSQWYAHVPLHDLQQKTIQQLALIALSEWKFIYQRQTDEYKFRIFNPTESSDGWDNHQTVLQFVLNDQPFLIDTITTEINRKGFSVGFMVHIGGIKVIRDAQNNIIKVLSFDAPIENALSEAVIYIEIDKEDKQETLDDLNDSLNRVIQDALLVVSDWRKIEAQVHTALKEIDEILPPVSDEERQEAKAFLHWLLNNHFTFLGYRKYDLKGQKENIALHLVPHSGLGVLRDVSCSKMVRYYSELPPEASKIALSKQILLLAKTNTRSTVHGHRYTDFVSIKRFNKQGESIGEHWFIGLYTSPVYTENPRTIPVIRLKVAAVLQRSCLPPNGHSYKALRHILETLPRDDLFHANLDELFSLGMGISEIQDRRCIRLFVRKDVFGRFISCLVYVPRDDFDMELCYRMRDILKEGFHAVEISYDTSFSDAILARTHFTIRINPKTQHRPYNIKTIERKLIAAGQSWKDGLHERLANRFGESRANELIVRYRRAFPASYREVFTPAQAVFDVERMERLSKNNMLEMALYRSKNASEHMVRFKLFHPGETIPLSDAIPILEKMGLRVIGEQPHHIILKNGESIWINDFNTFYAKDSPLDIEENKQIFQQAFKKIWDGEVEHDGFNALVLGAHLNWREVSMLRAYAKYLRQIGFTLSQDYMETALANNPIITTLLVQFFNYYFDPSLQSNKDLRSILSGLEAEINTALEAVINLDQDRILRMFLNLMHATVRTNYFQTTEQKLPKSYISFKFDCSKIIDLPRPHPEHEIFVYSPRFEGVHLRAGKVARGGIRWSDRREDFRTEILGLMKAQQVKNAVIVPTGAKGGFVPKLLPENGAREEIMQEGIKCYQSFIRGLLDLTDNREGKEIIRPENIVCYDNNDPYLVVAADKGTATFSDIANAISKEYHFWLGDAFASGGSAGYDHKKIGITARGAWESVKCHFQEINFDIDHLSFTVLGIGDMSGDVFGNGMLQSNHIKLVAAFNGTHIFLDPDPDVEVSFHERFRLFSLSRSSWEDYSSDLISAGGGVFRRAMKAIKLSAEVKKMLATDKELLTPNELIHMLLTMKMDLLWNGGIGTYVKSSKESHLDAGDRANDPIRVNGNELRCRVVGEGGNLGFTQLGRIEYELNGGRINTDFIDNSAGVDCSDHEVNIKILLNDVVTAGKLTEKRRNALLASMTDDVAQLVLHNNYRQVRAISLAVQQAMLYWDLYSRFMKDYARQGKIDLELEFLPDEQTLLSRKAMGKGLTRPEIAVLLAYSKIILKNEITASSLPQDPFFWRYIQYAFPVLLRKRYPKFMEQHRLRNEIIGTQLSNSIITDMGVTFVYQMTDETRASSVDVVRAYVVVCEIFNFDYFWNVIESLEIPAALQAEMTLEIVRLIRRSVRWFLKNQPSGFEVKKIIALFSRGIQQIKKILPSLLLGSEKVHVEAQRVKWIKAGVPSEIAYDFASLRVLYASLNIVEASISKRIDIEDVATVYFALEERLNLAEFREMINNYPVDSRWMVLARSAVKGDLDQSQRMLTLSVLKLKNKTRSVEECLEMWMSKHKNMVRHWHKVFSEIKASNSLEYSMLVVSMKELFDVAGSR